MVLCNELTINNDKILLKSLVPQEPETLDTVVKSITVSSDFNLSIAYSSPLTRNETGMSKQMSVSGYYKFMEFSIISSLMYPVR